MWADENCEYDPKRKGHGKVIARVLAYLRVRKTLDKNNRLVTSNSMKQFVVLIELSGGLELVAASRVKPTTKPLMFTPMTGEVEITR